MSKAAVVINPLAGRGRGKGLQLAETLRASSANHIDIVVFETFEELYPALQRMDSAGITDLFISSGDGTIQAIQTWLAESSRLKTLPRLCLLPHGTTNMTAADLGFRRHSISDQAAFITNVVPQDTQKRHTIRVANPADGKPKHGMFFGTGAVAEATRYCQRVFNDRGVHGSFATFATLATVAGKTVFSKSNPEDPNRFDRPYPISVESDGMPICGGQNLLMIATTLEKLILNSKPFWGGATAPLRVTTIPYPLPSVVRWLLPILYGGEHRTAPPGTQSKAVNACSVSCPTDFVIDGEFFAAPENAPLRLEIGPAFEYILQ